MDLNKIYFGDCLEVMGNISEASIDMILCDLPYGTTDLKWDVIIPFDKLWENYERIIKPSGAIILTSAQPFTTDLISSKRSLFRYEIIWEKTQKLGFLDANRKPLKGHENILVFYKKQPTYNPQKTIAKNAPIGRVRKTKEGRAEHYNKHLSGTYTEDGTRFPSSVLKISNWNGALFGNNSNATKHPTQKPVPLFEWLIKTYTNEGDTVLDNCSGSGTTAIACIRNNRNYICIEKNEQYYNDSLKRIENEKYKLF